MSNKRDADSNSISQKLKRLKISTLSVQTDLLRRVSPSSCTTARRTHSTECSVARFPLPGHRSRVTKVPTRRRLIIDDNDHRCDDDALLCEGDGNDGGAFLCENDDNVDYHGPVADLGLVDEATATDAFHHGRHDA